MPKETKKQVNAVHVGSVAATNTHIPDKNKCSCVICASIRQLEKLELAKLHKDYSVRENQMDVKSKRKFINLVGQKPMLDCFLGRKKFRVLWDTGSMVSVVDKAWLTQHFPQSKLLSVNDVLGDGELTIL